ncbi:MAG TPA: hypothetical protein VF420_13415 [Casimicrobiaceae bacterium]
MPDLRFAGGSSSSQPKAVCTYRVIDADTCHVFRDAPMRVVFLVFTCDRELAKRDVRCWACCVRAPGVTKTAEEFLLESWSSLGWSGEPPELRRDG